MRNNRIPRPNVVKRRAATEPTGMVPAGEYAPTTTTTSSDFSLNNNNAALVELFQTSTLHEL